MSFIDDHSRKIWIYPLKNKSDAMAAFKGFYAYVTTQKGLPLKCLRTDNGGEFTSKEFTNFCVSHGIKRKLTTPYNPSSMVWLRGIIKHCVRKFGACCPQPISLKCFGEKPLKLQFMYATDLPHMR